MTTSYDIASLDLAECLTRARQLILAECTRQGWPRKPVDPETWALFMAIETACSAHHNIAVREARAEPVGIVGPGYEPVGYKPAMARWKEFYARITGT